jgi:hypothetical protein
MLLKEMFSPIAAPKDQPDIDWLDDLKFYIDINNELLSNQLFPAIKKHTKYVGNPNAYKLYVKPLERCCEDYCNKFEIENPGEKFPKEQLIELAKKIAFEQEQNIKKGDYK